MACPFSAPRLDGAAYTLVPGFRTVVRDDYAGFSAVLGVEVGLGI